MHSREGECSRVVDVEDAGVRVRAAQHLAVEHAAKFDVVGERRVAVGEPDAIDLELRLPDDRHLGYVDRGDQAGTAGDAPGAVGVGVRDGGCRR